MVSRWPCQRHPEGTPILLRLASQPKLIFNFIDSVFDGFGWLSGGFGIIELLLLRRQPLLKSNNFRVGLRGRWRRLRNLAKVLRGRSFDGGLLRLRLG